MYHPLAMDQIRIQQAELRRRVEANRWHARDDREPARPPVVAAPTPLTAAAAGVHRHRDAPDAAGMRRLLSQLLFR